MKPFCRHWADFSYVAGIAIEEHLADGIQSESVQDRIGSCLIIIFTQWTVRQLPVANLKNACMGCDHKAIPLLLIIIFSFVSPLVLSSQGLRNY